MRKFFKVNASLLMLLVLTLAGVSQAKALDVVFGETYTASEGEVFDAVFVLDETTDLTVFVTGDTGTLLGEDEEMIFFDFDGSNFSVSPKQLLYVDVPAGTYHYTTSELSEASTYCFELGNQVGGGGDNPGGGDGTINVVFGTTYEITPFGNFEGVFTVSQSGTLTVVGSSGLEGSLINEAGNEVEMDGDIVFEEGNATAKYNISAGTYTYSASFCMSMTAITFEFDGEGGGGEDNPGGVLNVVFGEIYPVAQFGSFEGLITLEADETLNVYGYNGVEGSLFDASGNEVDYDDVAWGDPKTMVYNLTAGTYTYKVDYSWDAGSLKFELGEGGNDNPGGDDEGEELPAVLELNKTYEVKANSSMSGTLTITSAGELKIVGTPELNGYFANAQGNEVALKDTEEGEGYVANIYDVVPGEYYYGGYNETMKTITFVMEGTLYMAQPVVEPANGSIISGMGYVYFNWNGVELNLAEEGANALNRDLVTIYIDGEENTEWLSDDTSDFYAVNNLEGNEATGETYEVGQIVVYPGFASFGWTGNIRVVIEEGAVATLDGAISPALVADFTIYPQTDVMPTFDPASGASLEQGKALVTLSWEGLKVVDVLNVTNGVMAVDPTYENEPVEITTMFVEDGNLVLNLNDLATGDYNLEIAEGIVVLSNNTLNGAYYDYSFSVKEQEVSGEYDEVELGKVYDVTGTGTVKLYFTAPRDGILNVEQTGSEDSHLWTAVPNPGMIDGVPQIEKNILSADNIDRNAATGVNTLSYALTGGKTYYTYAKINQYDDLKTLKYVFEDATVAGEIKLNEETVITPGQVYSFTAPASGELSLQMNFYNTGLANNPATQYVFYTSPTCSDESAVGAISVGQGTDLEGWLIKFFVTEGTTYYVTNPTLISKVIYLLTLDEDVEASAELIYVEPTPGSAYDVVNYRYSFNLSFSPADATAESATFSYVSAATGEVVEMPAEVEYLGQASVLTVLTADNIVKVIEGKLAELDSDLVFTLKGVKAGGVYVNKTDIAEGVTIGENGEITVTFKYGLPIELLSSEFPEVLYQKFSENNDDAVATLVYSGNVKRVSEVSVIEGRVVQGGQSAGDNPPASVYVPAENISIDANVVKINFYGVDMSALAGGTVTIWIAGVVGENGLDAMYNGNSVFTEYVTLVTGTSGVASFVEALDGRYEVYSLDGVKVLSTDNAAELNNLGNGLYIVNGKKVLVRK